MQSVLGNESEQRETTTKKNALMNTGPWKKKAPKMEERGGSAGQAWCSKKSVSKAKMVNKKRKRDANGGRSRRRHRGGRSCMRRVREARIWRTLAFEAREGWQ